MRKPGQKYVLGLFIRDLGDNVCITNCYVVEAGFDAGLWERNNIMMLCVLVILCLPVQNGTMAMLRLSTN